MNHVLRFAYVVVLTWLFCLLAYAVGVQQAQGG